MLDCQNSFYGAKIVINSIFNKNMCHFNHFDTSFLPLGLAQYCLWW